MRLFAKDKKPEAPPPPVSPPASKPKADFTKTSISLKLDLPDVFAYEQDETRAKASACGRRGDDELRSTRGTVLLVESDEEICRLISRLLEHEGFAIVKSTCLAEARTAMSDVHVDFLLARRQSVPLNLQTEYILRDLASKTEIRVVDDFGELMLGQVVDYETMSHCALGLCDLLMSLLEGANIGARGHAHSVAKYCRLVGQRLGLTRRELDAVTMAAYLHDVGALETTHSIGALSLTKNELSVPSMRPTLDLLANMQFPYQVNELLAAAVEIRAAADAVPDKPTSPGERAHNTAPRGAQILRVADLYDTLRRANAGALEEDALFDQMRRLPTGTLDTDVLETFIHLRKQERAISTMNIFWAAVLLVDPHPEDAQLLRLRLENDDYHVLAAKSVEEALRALRGKRITLVLTEHHLEGSGDGFDLLRTLKTDPDLMRIPVVFYAPANTDLIKSALEQGAEDWITKPHNVEIMAMKLHRIVSRMHVDPAASQDGVQGNIRDMGIVEMVQVLGVGSRSVQMLLSKYKIPAEMILHRGQIISATAGQLEGEAAVLEILGWDEGQFRILPLKQPPPVTIRTSTDNLLLQSCYQKDKRNATTSSGNP